MVLNDRQKKELHDFEENSMANFLKKIQGDRIKLNVPNAPILF